MKNLLSVACAGLALLLASFASAESKEEARLSTALARARADLEAERKAVAEDEKRYEADARALRDRIGSLRAECESFGAELDRAKAKRADVRKAREEAEAEGNEALASETDLRKRLLDRIRALASKIELGVPHVRKAQRLSALRGIETTALAPDADLEALLASTFEAAIDEVLLGSECEHGTSVVLTAQGKTARADLVRFGKIFGAYKTEDGSHAAVLLPGIGETGGYEWRESDEAGKVVDRVRKGETGVHRIPLDVTLDIAADRFEIRKDLVSTLISGGLVMIPLALVALASLVLIAERVFILGRARARQAQIEAEVLAPLRGGEAAAATAACERIRGPAAAVLLAGLTAREGGKEAVEEAIEEAAVRALPRLERFLSAIAALAAIAPLLGLLGTVTGMISTFDVITLFGTSDPRLLSGGISEALITTQVGLIIAIPLLLVHRILSGAVERRVSAMETIGVSLVNALFHLPEPAPEEKAGAPETEEKA